MTVILSQTRKLIMQITQVCKEILDIKTHKLITRNLHPPKLLGSHKEPPSDKYAKDDTDCTHSSGNKSHDQNEDQRYSHCNPECHASELSSPPERPPPEPPEQQSSHASEPASSSEASTSSERPPSWTEDDNTAALLMDCNCSQRESQDDLGVMGLREGWEVECLSPDSFRVKELMVCHELAFFTLFSLLFYCIDTCCYSSKSYSNANLHSLLSISLSEPLYSSAPNVLLSVF